MKKILLAALFLLVFSGCDYIERSIYEVNTTDGKIIKFLCPSVPRDRNQFTYFIDGECVIVIENKHE